MKQTIKKMSDAELVRLAQADDKKAFRELLLRVQKNAIVFINYYDPDFSATNDLIQIILIKITKNLKYLKTPETFNKWAQKIIINSYYDKIKKINSHKRKFEFHNNHEERLEKLKSIEDNKFKPNEEILNSELKDKIHGAIMKLPKNHRIVILLRDMAGLSYEDIESVLNINKGTVKSRLARARNKLKQDLREYI